jgi:hypothetical protein
MAITKANAIVKGLEVRADGSVSATVRYDILGDDSAVITRNTVTDLVISNSTSAERTAAASLVSKAQTLALA